jgi:hypothetical protein
MCMDKKQEGKYRILISTGNFTKGISLMDRPLIWMIKAGAYLICLIIGALKVFSIKLMQVPPDFYRPE